MIRPESSSEQKSSVAMVQLKSKAGATWSRIARFFDVFSERFNRGPITSVDGLTRFVQTRASYVAQTSLYGYLKTRMGTSFAQYFQDEFFSRSIRISATKVFVSCLGDMAIFATATAKVRSTLGNEEAAALAFSCFDASIAHYLSAKDLLQIPAQSLPEFRRRAELTAWAMAAEGENAFLGSAGDLIRFAPVIDEFKELDGSIVRNSIRFRWRDARAEFRKRLDASAVAADWRRGGRPAMGKPS
jgi:hypothetical protein